MPAPFDLAALEQAARTFEGHPPAAPRTLPEMATWLLEHAPWMMQLCGSDAELVVRIARAENCRALREKQDGQAGKGAA